MSRSRPGYGHTSAFTHVAWLALAAVVVAGILLLDVPNRIAALGSGNLDRLVAPTTTKPFGTTIELAGRAERPDLGITAVQPVPTRSATRGVRARPGQRLWAVPITVRNLGARAWTSGAGMSTVQVFVGDDTGATYAVDTRVRRVRGARVLPEVLRIRAHQSVRGVVVVSAPRGATPNAVSVTVGSALTRTAAWIVPHRD